MKPRTVRIWATACLLLLGATAGSAMYAATRPPYAHWSDGAFAALERLEKARPGDKHAAEIRIELERLRRRLEHP